MNAPIVAGTFVPQAQDADAGTPSRSHRELRGVDAPIGEFDMRRVSAAAFRNRWTIAIIVAACLALGVLATVLATRAYSAASTVQVEQQTQRVLANDDSDAVAAGQDTDRFLQTQIDLIRSRNLAQRVAESQGLFRNDSFLTRMNVAPLAAPAGVKTITQTKREQVLDTLVRNLTVTLPRNSRVLEIRFRSPDPSLVAQIANAYAENYIQSNLQRRFDSSAYTRGFLERQLALTKQRLENSERAMIAYARAAGLLDTGGSGATRDEGQAPARSLTTSNLVALNGSFIEARTARIAAEERWRYAQSRPAEALAETLADGAIEQLVRERAIAQATLARERQRYQPGHPTFQQLEAQVNALDRQIATRSANLRNAIRDRYVISARQEDALRRQIDGLRNDTLSEQDRGVRYNILRRETDTNRELYNGLLQRYKEVSAQSGVTTNNISLIDRADIPSIPVSPRPLLNLLLALGAGLALAAVIVLARERLDDAIRSPDEVPIKLGLPFLGTIPRLPASMSPTDALADNRSGFAEGYLALRTALQLASSEGLFRSLLVTSGREGEGKSTTSVALARVFAGLGLQTLLIDADMRRPSIHRILDIANATGLSSVLARQAEFDTALQTTDLPGLSVLPSGPLPPSPPELLAGASFEAMLAAAEERFDVVIIDGPPVLGLADAVLLADRAESTLYVVEAGRSRHGQGSSALRRLRASSSRLEGAVLTKFDPRHAGYGDEYGYYTSYGRDEPRKDR